MCRTCAHEERTGRQAGLLMRHLPAVGCAAGERRRCARQAPLPCCFTPAARAASAAWRRDEGTECHGKAEGCKVGWHVGREAPRARAPAAACLPAGSRARARCPEATIASRPLGASNSRVLRLRKRHGTRLRPRGRQRRGDGGGGERGRLREGGHPQGQCSNRLGGVADGGRLSGGGGGLSIWAKEGAGRAVV